MDICQRILGALSVIRYGPHPYEEEPMSGSRLNRRDFVKVGAAGTAGMLIPGQAGSEPIPPAPPMTTRPLGRTGHQVKLFSLGGQATLEQPGTEEQSVAIINRAIDLGVNYLDTAAAYGRGISQTYLGKVMKDRRDEVFLATKTHDRTRDGSLRLLEQSLELLQTDHLDLWQLHNIMRTEQLDQIFGPGGAIEALAQARDEGTVRFLGITGHYDPDVLLDGINRFPFDTILMALNPADPHLLPFRERLLPAAVAKQMGIIGMKIPARGRIFRGDGIRSMSDALRWTLTQPVSTVIIGCDDLDQLEMNVEIAARFEPMQAEEMARVEEMTAHYVADAAFFKRGGGGFGGRALDDQQID
jgi:aryl-alcohol dehydrogenase-like predicted oxidoreductase